MLQVFFSLLTIKNNRVSSIIYPSFVLSREVGRRHGQEQLKNQYIQKTNVELTFEKNAAGVEGCCAFVSLKQRLYILRTISCEGGEIKIS